MQYISDDAYTTATILPLLTSLWTAVSSGHGNSKLTIHTKQGQTKKIIANCDSIVTCDVVWQFASGATSRCLILKSGGWEL